MKKLNAHTLKLSLLIATSSFALLACSGEEASPTTSAPASEKMSTPQTNDTTAAANMLGEAEVMVQEALAAGEARIAEAVEQIDEIKTEKMEELNQMAEDAKEDKIEDARAELDSKISGLLN